MKSVAQQKKEVKALSVEQKAELVRTGKARIYLIVGYMFNCDLVKDKYGNIEQFRITKEEAEKIKSLTAEPMKIVIDKSHAPKKHMIGKYSG